ncbi:MAG: UDP-N-acetylmuramate dehydrogenase [Pseudomonadales bacterium]|nr:UDP-N-acetylmuramate dehydrogenase [Pseudomonadales bacterium]
MQIETDYSLRTHNSFGFDVTARFWAQAQSTDDICEALQYAKAQRVPLMVLGEGSNLVFTAAYPGLVLNIAIRGKQIVREDSQHIWVRVGAGENWHDFVQWSLVHQYFGLENLILIPGSVGAAPIQNIGAYGVEVKSCFDQLEAVERDTGVLVVFDKESCEFDYRNSVFKSKLQDRYIISQVTFRLNKTPDLVTGYGDVEAELKSQGLADYEAINVAEAVSRIRRRKLPDPRVIGNAGSFFKNPIISRERFEQLKSSFPKLVGYEDCGSVKVAAGWMVDYCGWKGKREGDAGVHDQQALVLVNYGCANGAQVLDLAAKIQDSVKQTFGIDLEFEPQIYP